MLRYALVLAALVAGSGGLAWLLLGDLTSSAHRSDGGWSLLGRRGMAPGEFQQPRGISAFPDGSFVVVDRSARVQLFSADGKPLKLWRMRDSRAGNPKGLCTLPNGNLLVCDTHYSRVLEMTLDGATVKEWGGAQRFTRPLSCCVDAQRGAAYIVDYGYRNDRVIKYTLDGTFVREWGTNGAEPGQLQRPSGVAVDGFGNVYVADACNHRIQKFDADGKYLSSFGRAGREPGELYYPYDVACAPDGSVYVAEFNNHRISVFDRNGAFVRVLGAVGSGAGEFDSPWSLTVDGRGRLLVSDTANHRIQIVEPAEVKLRVAVKTRSE